MEFQLMDAFVAVAEEHNFGRAARRLNVAQSSVSLRLKRLEREVGVELVSRSSQPVRLTPAGQVFLDEVRQVLQLAGEAAETARAVAAGRRGTLRIGFNFAAGALVLPAALTRLHAERPGLRAELLRQDSGPQLRALAEGELDVALVFGAQHRPGWRTMLVHRVDLVALVDRRHSWVRRESVGFKELAEQRCVMPRRELCPAMYDELHTVARRAGTPLDVVAELRDPLATAVAVRTRRVVGFTTAPRLYQGTVAGLHTVPLTGPTPSLPVYAVWRGEEVSAPVRAFVNCLRAIGPANRPVGP
ncbi:LysR family transcriptional regulator [Nonomuraea sp. NPDC050404]|uniref:LysR family transcriptional regulator n=1 Tax=Nonomuraea sp. NPDC050404 TaxID=3155783 RepID=UPI0033C723A1